jgi:hypothetical protein
MLSSLALAAPESIKLEPYTVTFDLNTDLNYQIQPQEPTEYPFATVYPFLIQTDNSTGASISITEYKEPKDSTMLINEEVTSLRMALRGINATAPVEQMIDGNQGFVISGVPFPGTNMPTGFVFSQASFWTDSTNCDCGPVSVGNTSVGISSTYPQDVTMNLLNSLHIEKGQATATAA